MRTLILVNSLKEDEAGLAEEEMDETVEEGLTVTEETTEEPAMKYVTL